MRRIPAPAMAAVVLLAILSPAYATATCEAHHIGALDQLSVRAFAGQQGQKVIEKPLPDLAGCGNPTLCWLTPEQAANGRKCKEALPPDKSVKAFSIGIPNDDGTFSPLRIGQAEKLLKKDLSKLVVTYEPGGLVSREDEAVLQIEWDASEIDKHFVHGHAEAYQDARYRISIWAGGAYLYSRDNFSQGFPELRLLVETRMRDPYQHYEYCKQMPNPDPVRCPASVVAAPAPPWWNPNLRFYGDHGLTSTTAKSEVSPEAFAGTKAFDVSGALGLGPTFAVSPRDSEHDTWKFSVLLLVRFGLVSITETAATAGALKLPEQESLPFSSAFGLRVENENGHFAGAYAEFGVGQSNRFLYQKSRRLKVDLFLPFTEPGTIRLGARTQIDRPFPGSDLNEGCYPLTGTAATPPPEPCTGGGKVSFEQVHAGDVKISLLFNVDIRTLFDLLGASTSVRK